MQSTIWLITFVFPLLVYYFTLLFFEISGVDELLIIQSLYGLLSNFLAQLPSFITDFVIGLSSMKRLSGFFSQKAVY